MTQYQIINLSDLFGQTAKLADLDRYITEAARMAGDGNDVVLTGPGPVWLYLAIAHGLHGRARSLTYRSPVTGDVVIFDHNPF
ncbi:CRISPR-associated protein Csx3 [Desulfoluna butyratoxydans]|nr:CRISPR-associated protein Csx3 [Desulfoluna butyratoxydans]